MPLRTKVKVGHVNNLSEARYCAGMGVDLLGFPVGKGGLRPEQYKEIIEWVAGPEFVLETQNAGEPDRQYITNNFPGHYIQINKTQLGWLDDAKIRFILSIDASEWDQLAATLTGRANISYIELKVDKVSDERIPLIMKSYPVLVAITEPKEIVEVLRLPVTGIALHGSDEVRPGLKEYKLADILEGLEVE